MDNIKLTEIQTTSTVNSNAKVLITQPATGGTETVYRAAKDLIGKNYDTEISGLTTRVGTAETDIDTLETTVGTHTTNISGLTTRMTTAETTIASLTPKVVKNIVTNSSSFTVTYQDNSTKTWNYTLDSDGKITAITEAT